MRIAVSTSGTSSSSMQIWIIAPCAMPSAREQPQLDSIHSSSSIYKQARLELPAATRSARLLACSLVRLLERAVPCRASPCFAVPCGAVRPCGAYLVCLHHAARGDKLLNDVHAQLQP